ncbi:MAG: Gldg family protein [Deltaproteobacteria bacterium]|nr:Gldg family protein [Deltaproteobacteria bacterium]
MSGASGRAGAKWLLGVAAVALIAAAFAVTRIRSTPTLCTASTRLASTLTQSLDIEAFVFRGTPTLDRFVIDLEALLRRYEAAGKGNVHVRIRDSKDPATRNDAIQSGLNELSFGEPTDGDSATIVTGHMGIVLKYGAEKDLIAALSPDNALGLEFWITSKLRELRAKAEGRVFRVGVLTGHDELKLTESNFMSTGQVSIASVITQNVPYYQFVDVDLRAGEQEIDDALVGLIVTQPGKDLTEKELRRIDRFVMRGHPLAVFAGAANVRAGDATMQATLSTHGLERLLGGYGMEMGRDVVIDTAQPVRVTASTHRGVVSVAFPSFVEASSDPAKGGGARMLDPSHPVFFRLDTLGLPFASSIELKPARQPGASIRALARSSAQAERATSDTVDLRPSQTWPAPASPQQVVLAAVASGRLSSAFPSGDKMGIDAPARSTKDTRVVLIASSQFLANPVQRAARAPSAAPAAFPTGGDEALLMLSPSYAQNKLINTILAFKNTLDYLGFEDDFTECLPTGADAGR